MFLKQSVGKPMYSVTGSNAYVASRDARHGSCLGKTSFPGPHLDSFDISWKNSCFI